MFRLKGNQIYARTEEAQAVLVHRYGLQDHTPSTPEETASALHLTPDQVRTLEKEALRHLRRQAIPHLRDYAA